MPDTKIESLIIWNNPKHNPCLALIWLKRSAPLVRSESHGWKPASIQVKSTPGTVCNQQQQSQSVVVLWPLCAGLAPKKVSFNHMGWFTPKKQGWFLAMNPGRPDEEGWESGGEYQEHCRGSKLSWVLLHGWEVSSKKPAQPLTTEDPGWD